MGLGSGSGGLAGDWLAGRVPVHWLGATRKIRCITETVVALAVCGDD